MTELRRRQVTALLAALPVVARAAEQPPNALAERLAADPLRPQYHFLPPANWMNDPCGPIVVDGVTHLFYQYNPLKPSFGVMNWGHASSSDMIRWRHEPIALAPVPGGPDFGGVWTGSVVLDGAVPTALFTGVPGEVQCIATADRSLRTWKQNPVPVLSSRPPGLQVVGFRDPQVWRAGQEWRLVLGSGLKGGSGVVLQYRSADLRHWDFINVLYSLGPDVDQGETCECPDFFALGDRHVLLFSTAGHTWYVIGLYDNDRFVPERSGKLDAGIYYAAKSMADASGQRVVWGWINGGRLYADMDNQGWAGVMSLPRVLEIRDGALMVSPLPALSQLEKQEFFNSETNLAVATNGPAARIRAKVQGAGRIIFANTDEFVHVIYDPTKVGHELSCNEMTAPLAPGDDHGLDIFVDASVIEIFTSTGVCLTSRAWGNATGSFRLRLEGGFKNARVLGNSMQPISDDRLTSTVS